MVKYTIIFIMLFSSVAFGADSLKANIPMRLYYKDGRAIEPEWVPRVHLKDQDPNGWKFTGFDYWYCKHPRYERDSIHGSNGGWGLA